MQLRRRRQHFQVHIMPRHAHSDARRNASFGGTRYTLPHTQSFILPRQRKSVLAQQSIISSIRQTEVKGGAAQTTKRAVQTITSHVLKTKKTSVTYKLVGHRFPHCHRPWNLCCRHGSNTSFWFFYTWRCHARRHWHTQPGGCKTGSMQNTVLQGKPLWREGAAGRRGCHVCHATLSVIDSPRQSNTES